MKRILFFMMIMCVMFSLPEKMISSEATGMITFEFWPSATDWIACSEEMTCEVSYWGYDETANLELYYYPAEQYFYRTVEVGCGGIEYFFSICGEPIDDMSYYDGWFEPEADRFIDDGLGGYNAWVQIY